MYNWNSLIYGLLHSLILNVIQLNLKMRRHHKINRIIFYAHRDYVIFWLHNFFPFLNKNPIKMLNQSGNRCACGFSTFKKIECINGLFSSSPSTSTLSLIYPISFQYVFHFFMFCRSVVQSPILCAFNKIATYFPI